MWKKFQKFPPCTLQDISVLIDKNPFWGLQKTRQLYFKKPHWYEKITKMVVTLWIHS